MSKVYVAVIHYPAYDKNRKIIATSVTNIELHDIARSCMTFDIDLCYIVTPLSKQREIMERLIEHWNRGYGSVYNPLRGIALDKIKIIGSFDEVISEVKRNGEPVIIGTSSIERREKAIGYKTLRNWIEREERPFLILFGTGWGLTDETVKMCDKVLIPIKGRGSYNHLSLRVAFGIVLDRIFGERGGKDE
ncbi:MAG: RNA methyltransferase [Syntrophorhabdaceae bacterium]|nr:RNA methyltransferase [Syntrophorhabdaceae bacterium]